MSPSSAAAAADVSAMSVEEKALTLLSLMHPEHATVVVTLGSRGALMVSTLEIRGGGGGGNESVEKKRKKKTSTNQKQGSSAAQHYFVVTVPSAPVSHIVSTTGAGDSLNAGFITGLLLIAENQQHNQQEQKVSLACMC